MTEAPLSPLRRRMIEDITIRKFAPRTQEGYIHAVKSFSAFLRASPDTASAEDLRRYRLHLVASGTGVPTINHTLTALRFPGDAAQARRRARHAVRAGTAAAADRPEPGGVSSTRRRTGDTGASPLSTFADVERSASFELQTRSGVSGAEVSAALTGALICICAATHNWGFRQADRCAGTALEAPLTDVISHTLVASEVFCMARTYLSWHTQW
jgi:hypothetical protein